MREKNRASASATPPGARVAFEDEKGRVFFETFDDAEGARAVPFSATLVPWSDEARATYERRVSEKRGAAPRVDAAAAATSAEKEIGTSRTRCSADASTSLAAYLAELGVERPAEPSAPDGARKLDGEKSRVSRLGAGADGKRDERVPEAFSGSLFDRDETRPRDDTANAVGGSVASARVARTLAALAPEIQLETSFAETGRFFRPEAFSKNERSFVREGAFGEARELSDAVGSAKTVHTSRPGVVRHIARIVGAVEIRDATNATREREKTQRNAAKRERLRLAVLVAAESAFERRHTLRSILAGTPEALAGDAAKKLVCFQMAAGVAEAHARGLSFRGRLGAGDVLVRGAPASPRVELDPAALFADGSGGSDTSDASDTTPDAAPLDGDLSRDSVNAADRLASATNAWRAGAMSTLDYLLAVNARAGRFRGRRDRHAFVPWVADFSENPDAMLRDSLRDSSEAERVSFRSTSRSTAATRDDDKGWRDLSRTKWRLTKGDAQLDFSFANASPPHHVSDECLCETTACVYLARVLPISELRARVRRRFVANEYPSSIERLYAWSPDEAVPQFYDDPSVFSASASNERDAKRANGAVSGLGDLRVPSRSGWGDDAAAFVKKHRALLESDFVAARLPKWIDLTFGVALFGDAAVAEKNVMAPSSDPTRPDANARVAVFFHPHPPRGGAVPRGVETKGPDVGAVFIENTRDDVDPTLTPALRGDDPISLAGTPFAAPDALKRALTPGPHVFATGQTFSETFPETSVMSTCSDSIASRASGLGCSSVTSSFEADCARDSAALGRLFAAAYSNEVTESARLVSDPTRLVDVNALPLSARAMIEGLLRCGGVPHDDKVGDDDVTVCGVKNRRGLTATAAMNSTFFSPSVRAAARALAILHGGGDAERFSIGDDSTILTALRAARAALASCASDVEATALVAPAAAEAAREAIRALALRAERRSKRWAKKTSRLIGSVALRVARRAPRAVARDTLPPLFRDALAGAATGDVEDDDESESEIESESDASDDASDDGSPKKKKKIACTIFSRDVLRREMLRPAVLRAARVALGDEFYAASIRDARVFACLRPGVSAKTARAAAAALEAEASPSETPLPVAVREIFSKGLLRRLRYGDAVARAIARVGDAFGSVNVRKFVVPALVRALGEDTHLATVASAARRAAERFERFERVSKKSSFQKDDDDREVTPAAAVAAAEGSACKGGWSLTPMRRQTLTREHSSQVEQDFSRESGAAAALASVLPHTDRPTLLNFLFPAFPAPPGPLLRILLAPAPSLALCVAAAELVAAAAARLSPDDAFARALPRLKPLFAVACRVSDDEEEDAAALTLAFALYPALGDRVGFRALRDAVPDAPLLEARFATRFDGWTAEQHYERSRDLSRCRRTDASRSAFPSVETVPKPFRDSAPHSWLPAPETRELETAALVSRVGAILDDDRDDAPNAFEDDDDVPWALRLETLCSWRAHEGGSFSEDAGRTHAQPLPRWESRGVSAFVSSADERWLATCGAGAASRSSVVKVWSAGGPRGVLRDGRDGDDAVDAPAPCFATHDAHEGRVTCVAFLNAYRGGGVALAASADDAGAVHVWRADTGASLSRVREPRDRDPRETSAPLRFAGSRDAAFGGWERRARAIERRKRIADAILDRTRAEDEDEDEDATTRSKKSVSSDDGDGDASAAEVLTKYVAERSEKERARRGSDRSNAPRRETSASSDVLLDELSGPELGELIGDDVLGDVPRRRRAADAGETLSAARLEMYKPRSTGYACLAPTPDARELVVGTEDGRVRFVDVARERVAGSWLCRAGGTDASHSADGIVSVCFPGASTGVTSSARALSCAGARSGAVSFLDRRGGRLVAGFRAHDDAVVATAARGGDGAFSTAPYCLVTASRDETVAVWDVRMLTDGAFATSGFETSKKTKTPLLASFGGFGDGVRGMALRGADAFVVAGEKVSVFSLDDRPVEKQSDTRRQRERMSVPVAPLRLRAHGGAKVRARLTGVAALPRSRLFAVTDEDGKVRVCR